MNVDSMHEALRTASDEAARFLQTLSSRPVGATASLAELRASLDIGLPDQGADPSRVIEELARAADAGLTASAGPRYFGFVIGGSHPAGVAADWLVSAWDQNAGLYATSPAAAVVEEVAAKWLLELFGLPRSASVGFVTGGQMANFTCLAAARHAVLGRAGWDVEEDGLNGAPPVHVVLGAEAHVTVFNALSMLGLGKGKARLVEADREGRMQPGALESTLKSVSGPTIVVAQVGHVNSGAIDPAGLLAHITHGRGGWLHVDGAFGLWAAASPHRRSLVSGLSLADSWSVDAHKWLSVPYDSGLAIVAEPDAHRGCMSASASYLKQAEQSERDPLMYTPELSRRARGFAVYAVLRTLGRQGVAELVDRLCDRAGQMAARLASEEGVEILNDVVLNQVLVGFRPPAGRDASTFTNRIIGRVQIEGTCWLGGTMWLGRPAMRISVCNWSTSARDIDRSADAVLAAYRQESAVQPD